MAETTRRLHDLLVDFSRQWPDRCIVEFGGGQELTGDQLCDLSRTLAAGLSSLAIGPGDRVATFLDNCPEQLITMFGTSIAEGVLAPFNTDLIGPMLVRMLRDTEPAVIVTESRFLDRIRAAVDESCTVVLTDTGNDAARQHGALSWEALLARGSETAAALPRTDDGPTLAMILYTSGTTGASKGVMVTHEMACTWAESAQEVVGYTADDVTLTCLPLYHSNALFVTLLPAMLAGAKTVVTPRFSASRFWQDVRQHGATVTSVLGSMAPILLTLPQAETDTAHLLRLVVMIPRGGALSETFEDRFWVRTTELYGLTDFGIPIGIPSGENHPSSCGRQLSQWECMIVDSHDRPVDPGVVGELVLRPRRPWMTQFGYWNNPEATVAAWRNLWLHTGDLMRVDDQGWFSFVGRDKDMIRRSGENISAFEVEQVLLLHLSVQDAAVVGVPDSVHGEEVMAVLVPRIGHKLDWNEILAHCERNIAYFAVPRYYAASDQLPRTESQKVKKSELMANFDVGRTWDAGPRGRNARVMRKPPTGQKEAT